LCRVREGGEAERAGNREGTELTLMQRQREKRGRESRKQRRD